MVVVLQPDGAQQMQEVVVIGYGAVKKGDLTGSVLAMKPDTKNKGLVVNAQDMMQGKMAGVNVNKRWRYSWWWRTDSYSWWFFIERI